MRDQIKEEIKLLEESLKESFEGLEFIDGDLVDVKTFETVRKATKEEFCNFYKIRLLKLQLRNLERNDVIR